MAEARIPQNRYLIRSFLDSTNGERENEYEEFSTWKTGVPLLSGRAGLRWEGGLGVVPAAWSDFYLRGESGSELEEPGTVRNILEDKDSWITVNLAGGLALGNEQQYRLTLELLNLLDEEYFAFGIDQGTQAFAESASVRGLNKAKE